MSSEDYAIARKPALGDINEKLFKLHEILNSDSPSCLDVVKLLQVLTVDDEAVAEAKKWLIQTLLIAHYYNIPLLGLPYWRIAVLSLADSLAAAGKNKLAAVVREAGAGVHYKKLG